VASIARDGNLPRAERVIELGRLNDAERRVLRLLAEGHTAKSIANTLGTTAPAVNERLREARRKTGVGSSRELARLLKAQENRHDEMGVGGSRRPMALLVRPDAKPWRPQIGVIAMIAIVLVTAAGAAALMSQTPSSTAEVDPLIGSQLERFPQPADLHTKVRAEARDNLWAPATEAAIRARVDQIPLVGRSGNLLRVTCASTLCEIAGTLLTPASKHEQDDQNSPVNRTVKALQVPPLPDDLAKLGLKSESGTFASAKGKPDRLVYLLYYSRVK
jgi:DNA-binding CsgD family transcriptional regulator